MSAWKTFVLLLPLLLLTSQGRSARAAEELLLRLPGTPSPPPRYFTEKLNEFPVIFIPGIAGSKLVRNNKVIWGSLFETDFNELQLPMPFAKDGLIATKIMDDFVILGPIKSEQYSNLIKFYTETLGYQKDLNFFTFPYDWRLPIEDSAEKLDEAIKKWRQKNFKKKDAKVILLTHSMGGLVAKTYIQRFGKKDEVARLIFMGTPHLGSLEVFTLLLEGAYGPFSSKVRRAAFTFPSVFQLLPFHWLKFARDRKTASYVDVYDASNWKRFKWIPPDIPEEKALPHLQDMLIRARSFQDSLRDFPPSGNMVTFFGYGNKTPVGYDLLETGELEPKYISDGDSRVTFSSAVPYKGILDFETHPITQKHGSLYADTNLKRWLSYETSRLFDPDTGDIFKALSGDPPIPSPSKLDILQALTTTLSEGVFLDTQLKEEFVGPGRELEVLGVITVPKGYSLKSAQLALRVQERVVPMRPYSEMRDSRVDSYLKNLDLGKVRDRYFFLGIMRAPEPPGIYRAETSAIFFVEDNAKKAARPFERTIFDQFQVISSE